MKILVNARFLIPGKLEGLGLYTYEMIKSLSSQHREDQFILCVDRHSAMQFDFGANVTFHLIQPPARHPLLFIWWFEIGITNFYKAQNCDLFFSPDGFCSLSDKVDRTLVVIHDLAYLHYPEQISAIMRWYYRRFTPRFIDKATQIITVSNATKEDLVTHFPHAGEKVSVIYNGIRNPIRNQPDLAAISWQNPCGDRPYFMTIGSIHPRKNTAGVLNAFRIFKQRNKCNICLLIVGRRAWMTSEIDSLYQAHPFKESIFFTGYLADESMFSALKNCLGLVYVSFFEGFGLPLVEAMAEGVPVITSSRSSMIEVAERAALLVDPENPNDIAEAMFQLATDDTVRSTLISQGYIRAKHFSWDIAAAETWKIIQQIHSGSNS
ncbi:MAG: glycosyltransferase family 4 protein [Saprospiraceae bacterium]|nr:glycosyltransferase family 4 protein [Saprospiraceae bacterium]